MDRQRRGLAGALGIRETASPGTARGAKPALARNAVDAFVLQGLEREGLTPAPPARKQALIRRASLDLTGLPPTIDEVDAFLADRSPDAYNQLVTPPRIATVRGTSGAVLARCRAVRRFPRLPHRLESGHLGLSRLGGSLVQPEPAVRRVHHRAVGRRSPARAHPGSADRHRLHPL